MSICHAGACCNGSREDMHAAALPLAACRLRVLGRGQRAGGTDQAAARRPFAARDGARDGKPAHRPSPGVRPGEPAGHRRGGGRTGESGGHAIRQLGAARRPAAGSKDEGKPHDHAQAALVAHRGAGSRRPIVPVAQFVSMQARLAREGKAPRGSGTRRTASLRSSVVEVAIRRVRAGVASHGVKAMCSDC